MRIRFVFLLALSLSACGQEQSDNQIKTLAQWPDQANSTRFDYWLLALSWSPEYCASSEARPDSRQCSKAHEFVVHGLWPQFERGHPEYCDSSTRVANETADAIDALVPDRGLVFHQWKKHGSCSGLSPDNYFDALSRAARSVKIPSQALAQGARGIARTRLENEFIKANPGLSTESVVFECRRDYLREVRVCLDLNLNPRACGDDVREACAKRLRIRQP